MSNNIGDDFNYTKSSFLQKISTLFNPLRLLAPFVIRSNILIQETWSAGIDCNEKVPVAIEQAMKKWFQELQILDHFKVERYAQENKEHFETNVSIHSYS